MFRKIVAIEDVLLSPEADERLHDFAAEVVMYRDMPGSDEEVIRRIGDADCVLVSFKTKISRRVMEACQGIRYIGMCCTLYGGSSCNVDLTAARERNITVTGVRDYGDEGVVEYVISEAVRLLHGFGERQWRAQKYELGDMNVGIIGLGTTGRMCVMPSASSGAMSTTSAAPGSRRRSRPESPVSTCTDSCAGVISSLRPCRATHICCRKRNSGSWAGAKSS